MVTKRMRIALGPAAGLLALAAMASPVAAAGSPDIYSFGDTYSAQHDCGVVETTTMTAKARDYFDASGNWLRSIINFHFIGTFVGPTGASFTSESHQNVTVTATTVALSGQGSFMRAGGKPILMDVGRLVIALPDGTTIHDSDKVIAFVDPDGPSLDEVLCAELGT